VAGLATLALDLGLGGSFRRTIVDSADTVAACWPLAEISLNTARNIVREAHDGTYYGPLGGIADGLSHGESLDIPEGCLGAGFDGSGDYVEVPDDSTDGATPNLSCTGGIDVIFLITTSTNDATTRAIVQKWTGTNGWYVGLINGAIVFRLTVGGVDVFNFTRGAISDGALHVVHCHYSAADNRARVYIDGALSGASVAASTAVAATTANLRIAVFNDDSGPFIGTVAYVTVGSINDVTISADLYSAMQWTDYSSGGLVRMGGGIQLQYGIPGSQPNDRVASTGTLQFALTNVNPATGANGYHSIGHANCRAGFDLSIPVRLRLSYAGTTYYKFRGYLKSASPVPSQYGGVKEVRCTAIDWMGVAAEQPITELPTAVDLLSWFHFGYVAELSDRPPCGLAIDFNADTFPYAFDSSRSEDMPALSEFQRIAMSEFGYVFIKGDTTRGGNLAYQTRSTRQDLAVSATLDNTMAELEFTYDRDTMINRAKATYYPREVGASTVVLYSLSSPYLVHAGETVVIEGRYFDVTDASLRVGGTDLQAVTQTTDFTMNTAADGSGSDRTGSFNVTESAGANSVRIEVENQGEVDAYITLLQVRGKPIYHYDPVTVTYEDGDSVRKHGARTFTFDMPYQSDAEDAESACRVIVSQFKDPLSNVRRVKFHGDRSSTLMTYALAREPGELIEVREAMVSGDTYHQYYIHRVLLDVLPSGRIDCTWTVAPVGAITAWWVLGEVGSELGVNTILGWGS
jgi:hypothetical protein